MYKSRYFLVLALVTLSDALAACSGPAPANGVSGGALSATGYAGCYTDSSTRALPTQLGWSNGTVETCLAAAKAKNLAYAGLQYGGECWGGNTLGYTLVSDSSCNMKCSGNSSQICGGSWRNSVYSTAAVVASAPVAGYAGCYTDSSTRALPTQLGWSNGTVETCLAAAKAKNLAYAGLQYAGECWGGNTLGYTLVSDSGCNMKCSGNSSQICGGSWRNSVYSTAGTTTVPVAVTPKNTTAPGTAVAVSISPATAAVDACQTYTFTASVTGTSNTAVTWSTSEGSVGGTISSAGVYTAPATAGTYHVVATSQADTTKTVSATLTVTERIVSVAVNPQTVTVSQGGTAQLSATVTTTCGAFTVTN